MSETKGQMKLYNLIQRMGFHVEPEKHFAPYTVDIYLQEFHVAVEYDGTKWHSFTKRDKKRDDLLMKKYYLPICRITEKTIGDTTFIINNFLAKWSLSGRERKLKCEGGW